MSKATAQPLIGVLALVAGAATRADLSERQRAADRAGAGGRRDRHHGAHRRAAAQRALGPDGRRRQPSGRQLRGRSAGGGARARGRLTLLVAPDSTFTANPHLFSKLPYDRKDFTPIIVLCRATPVLVVNPSLPATERRRS